MEMTGLEVFLGGTALTALGGWLSAIRGVSRGECKQLRDHIRADLLREINEDRESVKLHQEKVSRQLNSLFFGALPSCSNIANEFSVFIE